MRHEPHVPVARQTVALCGAMLLVLAGCGTQQADIGELSDAGTVVDANFLPDGAPIPSGDSATCTSGRDRTGCPCTPGEVRACYSGPPGTEGVDPCKGGNQVCMDPNDPTYTLGSFGPCEGQVLPTATATCVPDGGVDSGILTDSGVIDSPADSPVGDGSCNLVQVSPMGNTMCAITSAGHVACKGQYPGNGAIGMPGGPTVDKFEWVVGLSDVVAMTGNSSLCALQKTGTVMCWGQNESGQCGDGTTDTPRLKPVKVVGLTDAVEISGGTWHVCARRATGQVVCWGANMRGQLGDGTGHGITVDAASASPLHSATPVKVVGITDAAQIASGAFHSCARSKSGSVDCWGQNNAGQIGDGTFGFAATPPNPPSTTLIRATPVPVIGLTNATYISGSGWNTCAVRATGAVACWGGMVPPGTGAGGLSPTEIAGIGDAITAHLGQYVGCAFRKGGVVTCWGDNDSCGLGNGTRSPTSPAPALDAPGTSPLGVKDVVSFEMNMTDVGGVVDKSGCGKYWGLTDSKETSWCVATPKPVVLPP